MNKHTFKQCLTIIDHIEIQGLNPAQLQDNFFIACTKQKIGLNKKQTDDLIAALLHRQLIKQFRNICDLVVPLTVFARAPHYSTSETLGLLESILPLPNIHALLTTLLEDRIPLESLTSLFPEFPWFGGMLLELKFLEEDQQQYRLLPELQPLLRALLSSDTDHLVSPISIAYFIRDMLDLASITFKNKKATMVSYPHQDIVLAAVPYHGIPENRSISEPLQRFFKDCLFHEFEHQCLLCQINIPQLLIASHIKPFRDCGHLIESTDFNNGILLCRNHDFLFDQGYLAFDHNGQLLVGGIDPNDYHHYQIPVNFVLPKKLRTPRRSQFLTYHHQTYFRGK